MEKRKSKTGKKADTYNISEVFIHLERGVNASGIVTGRKGARGCYCVLAHDGQDNCPSTYKVRITEGLGSGIGSLHSRCLLSSMSHVVDLA